MAFMKFDFGPYFVDRGERPDGSSDMCFEVPAAIRPKGWRPSIPLPCSKSKNPPQSEMELLDVILADVNQLYASLAREIGGEPLRAEVTVGTDRSYTARQNAKERREREGSEPRLPRALRPPPEPVATSELPPLLTLDQIAAIAHCGKSTLIRRRKENPAWLPRAPIQLGRSLVFRREDVCRVLGIGAPDLTDRPPSGWGFDAAAFKEARQRRRGRRSQGAASLKVVADNAAETDVPEEDLMAAIAFWARHKRRPATAEEWALAHEMEAKRERRLQAMRAKAGQSAQLNQRIAEERDAERLRLRSGPPPPSEPIEE